MMQCSAVRCRLYAANACRANVLSALASSLMADPSILVSVSVWREM